MTEIDAARVLLGVTEGDGETRLRERYRLLVYAWHPDRFVGNDALRPAAQTELARINDAYELLMGKRAPALIGGRSRSGKKSIKLRFCENHTYEDTLLRCDHCGQLVCHLCASATRAGGYMCKSCEVSPRPRRVPESSLN